MYSSLKNIFCCSNPCKKDDNEVTGNANQLKPLNIQYNQQRTREIVEAITPREPMLMDDISLKRNSGISLKDLEKVMRLQAHLRGMLTRKNLINSIINTHHIDKSVGTSSIDYFNDKVQKTKNHNRQFSYNQLREIDLSKLEFRPMQILPNYAKYDGQWVIGTNIKCGKGKQVWSDGSIYEGWWYDSKASGQGRLIYANGDLYEGNWYNDMAHGHGKYVHFEDGSKYEGSWENNKQHGPGVEVWPDGSKYKGHFVNGKKDGMATYTQSDGSVYIGHFKDNNIHGQGSLAWSDGRKFEGEWHNNQMHGYGTYTWPDGKIYKGYFQNDKKQGHGILEWFDGRKYDGNWQDGKQHGNGYYTNHNGLTKQGIWENGHRLKWIQDNDEQQVEKQSE